MNIPEKFKKQLKVRTPFWIAFGCAFWGVYNSAPYLLNDHRSSWLLFIQGLLIYFNGWMNGMSHQKTKNRAIILNDMSNGFITPQDSISRLQKI